MAGQNRVVQGSTGQYTHLLVFEKVQTSQVSKGQ